MVAATRTLFNQMQLYAPAKCLLPELEAERASLIAEQERQMRSQGYHSTLIGPLRSNERRCIGAGQSGAQTRLQRGITAGIFTRIMGSSTDTSTIFDHRMDHIGEEDPFYRLVSGCTLSSMHWPLTRPEISSIIPISRQHGYFDTSVEFVFDNIMLSAYRSPCVIRERVFRP